MIDIHGGFFTDYKHNLIFRHGVAAFTIVSQTGLTIGIWHCTCNVCTILGTRYYIRSGTCSSRLVGFAMYV